MNWKLEYLPEAEKDLKDLDGSQRILVLKAIKKVQQNPLPVEEQGYGKPLGNHSSTNLAGLLKIKLRSAGLRVVYQLRRTESSMMIIVIGVRADEEVYEITTEPSDFTQVSEKLEEAGLEFLEAEVQMVPTTTVQLDEKGIEKMERLIERLEELDDVANIYHNWEE